MSKRSRKRVTHRPGKANGVFAVIWGGIFILIGLFEAIPNAGLFGLLWTGMAIAITGYTAYQFFGKKYFSPEIHIEKESSFSYDSADHQHISSIGPDHKKRLEQLDTMLGAGLLTREEYGQRRRALLRELMEREKL